MTSLFIKGLDTNPISLYYDCHTIGPFPSWVWYVYGAHRPKSERCTPKDDSVNNAHPASSGSAALAHVHKSKCGGGNQ